MQRAQLLGIACVVLCLVSGTAGRSLADDSQTIAAHARSLKQTGTLGCSDNCRHSGFGGHVARLPRFVDPIH